jgi:hypothetical protein
MAEDFLPLIATDDDVVKRRSNSTRVFPAMRADIDDGKVISPILLRSDPAVALNPRDSWRSGLYHVVPVGKRAPGFDKSTTIVTS